MNLCAYVGNDPVNYVDPLGLASCRQPDCDPNPIIVVPRNYSITSICGGDSYDDCSDLLLDLRLRAMFTADINRYRNFHDCAVGEIASGMEMAGANTVREVTFTTGDGRRTARFDIVAVDPSRNVPVGVVEVKTTGGNLFETIGERVLQRNQPAVARAIRDGTAIPVGANAQAAGFTPNQPLGRGLSVAIVLVSRSDLNARLCPM